MATLGTYRHEPTTSLKVQEARTVVQTILALETTDRDPKFAYGDNSLNTNITYLKFWNNATANPDVDAPDMIIPVGAAQKDTVHFIPGVVDVFSTATGVCATSTLASEVAQSAPANAFDVDLGTDAGS